MYFVYIFLIIICLLLVINLRNYLRAVYVALQMPGPFALPIIGNVQLISNQKKMIDYGNNLNKYFGPITKIWLLVWPFFLITDPVDLQIILNNIKLAEKNMFYIFLRNFIGEGLITHNGEKWKIHRKYIQPYFHINMLKNHINIFNKYAKNLVNNMKNCHNINITSLINQTVLDILHESILGIINDENSPYRKGQNTMPYRIAHPWLLIEFIFNITTCAKNELKHNIIMKNFTRKILENKRKFSQSSNFPSLMDYLIELSKNHQDFTDNDIINESNTFMLAGQDSVGSTLAFAIFYLAKYQDIQEKVYEEIQLLYDNDENFHINFENLNKMKYLEQCIRETLRLCPAIPIISRKLNEDITFGKYTLPKDSNILISPYITHRLPHLYEDPLKFNPDRFSMDKIKNSNNQYAFLPFIVGPRNCIGYKFALMEMKVILIEILRNYHISLVSGHEELDILYKIILKAKGGIHITLKNRQ